MSQRRPRVEIMNAGDGDNNANSSSSSTSSSSSSYNIYNNVVSYWNERSRQQQQQEQESSSSSSSSTTEESDNNNNNNHNDTLLFGLDFPHMNAAAAQFLAEAVQRHRPSIERLRFGEMHVAAPEQAAVAHWFRLFLASGTLRHVTFCGTRQLNYWAMLLAGGQAEPEQLQVDQTAAIDAIKSLGSSSSCWPRHLERVHLEQVRLEGSGAQALLQKLLADDQTLKELEFDHCSFHLETLSEAWKAYRAQRVPRREDEENQGSNQKNNNHQNNTEDDDEVNKNKQSSNNKNGSSITLFRMYRCGMGRRNTNIQVGSLRTMMGVTLECLLGFKSQLTTLALNHQHLPMTALTPLAQIMKHNPRLTSLDISGNQQIFSLHGAMGVSRQRFSSSTAGVPSEELTILEQLEAEGDKSVESAQKHIDAFIDAVQDHPALESLQLRRCGVKDQLVYQLFQALQGTEPTTLCKKSTSLEEICLQSNSFSCHGEWVDRLAQLLHLKSLVLPHGMLTCADVRRLVESLQRNTCLEQFSFGGMVMNQMRPYLARNEYFGKSFGVLQESLSMTTTATTTDNHSSDRIPLSLIPVMMERLGESSDCGAVVIFPLLQFCLANNLF